MLFNSFEFLYLFLPILLLIYYTFSKNIVILILSIFSLIFYCYSEYKFVYILIISILFNYIAGKYLSKTNFSKKQKKLILIFAVSVNIATLIYFKYFNFLLESLNHLFDKNISFNFVVLPLGISFFTFTQLAFLVDCYQDKAKAENFTQYFLFVTYFPHLIAGPILHHKPMISQFKNININIFNARNMVCGILFLIIGLTKKVLIADRLIPYVNYVFEAKNIHNITFLDSYLGVLSYTLQLYFDFSGYCDMAIGISKMFNIDLPINFNSPYKAKTIIDFW